MYGEEKAKDIINRVQLNKKKNRENKKENF